MNKKRKLKIHDLNFELVKKKESSIPPSISIGREGEELKIKPCLDQIRELRDLLNEFIQESNLHKALKENDA